MRLSRIGAAFGASVVVLSATTYDAAAESAAQPVIACFKPADLAALETSSPQSASVKEAFSSGRCVAFASSSEVRSLEKTSDGSRFHLGESPAWFYAGDWSADALAAYAQYVPVTDALLVNGRNLAACAQDARQLDARSDAFDREWSEYWASFPSQGGPAGMRYIAYLGPKGQRLSAEREALSASWNDLQTRCEAYQPIAVHKSFAEFLFGPVPAT